MIAQGMQRYFRRRSRDPLRSLVHEGRGVNLWHPQVSPLSLPRTQSNKYNHDSLIKMLMKLQI